MLNLKLVTFEGDDTQFLVNANTSTQAIELANRANLEIIGEMDDDDYDLKHYKESWYTVEEVDWKLLLEIFNRTDCIGTTSYAIAFLD